MATTIQISEELAKKLKEKKLDNESYEDLIWNLIEDTQELSEQTRQNMEISRRQFREGKLHTLESVKKELKL